MKTIKWLLPAIACFISLSSCAQDEKEPQKVYFTNPIIEYGADPWVMEHDGKYWYCSSDRGGICISSSDEMHVIKSVHKIWFPKADAWNRMHIWAPEIHRWNGAWYILYAAGEAGPPYIHQRAGVLEYKGTNPIGGVWTDKGMVFTGDILGDWESNRWAIDMTLLEHNGKLYAVWSGWENLADTDATPQNLYIAEMENPWTAKTARVLISKPDADYEIIGKNLPINEGPQILKNGDDVFIVYSCGQSWLTTYKLSALRLKSPTADPLDPESWTKSPKPLFTGNDEAFGVGHASFVKAADGQNWIYYHTKKSKASGWDREVRLQPFDFDENGWPRFGEPVPNGQPIEIPVSF